MNAIFLSVLLSVPPQAPSLMPVQAPPIIRTDCGCAYGEPCGCVVCTCLIPAYDAAAKAAIHYHRPLLVFVNCKVRPIAGCAVCASTACFNDSSPRIIIATCKDGELHWQTDLPANTTDDAVLVVVANKITKRSNTVTPNVTSPVFRPVRMSFSGGGRGGSC